MGNSFDTIWQSLNDRLVIGTVIRNWTALHGYLGDTMTVEAVDPTEYVIRAPKAKSLQHVSCKEFEEVFAVWEDYKAGRVQRQTLREMNHHTKYIISVLRWLEETNHR